MRIQRSLRNDISPAVAYELAISRPFQEKKCRDAGALSWDVGIDVRADGATVRARRKLPTIGFPAAMRKFVPFGVTSTETIEWGPARADGSRHGTLSVHFHGAPAAMTGTVGILAVDDGASDVVLDLDFRSHVPLIGGVLERFAAPIIVGVIEAEQATGRAWVAGAR